MENKVEQQKEIKRDSLKKALFLILQLNYWLI